MTITIDIHLHPEQGPIDKQLDEHLAALGYSRTLVDYPSKTAAPVAPQPPVANEDEVIAAEGIRPETPDQPAPAAAPKRERGKPSPGHARRTKAEIAEDEEAAVVEAQSSAMAGKNAGAIAAAANATPAISTGEERVGPEDTPEDRAQDAADEAAETAAAKAETGGKLTLDDVRNVLGLYVKGYGLAAAQEDGPIIISEVCGEGKVKVSDVPDDKIAAVIEAVKAAGRTNAFGRTAVTN